MNKTHNSDHESNLESTNDSSVSKLGAVLGELIRHDEFANVSPEVNKAMCELLNERIGREPVSEILQPECYSMEKQKIK